MHCIHCGAEIPDYAKFCTSCGKPVAQEPIVNDAPFEPVEETGENAEGYTAPENASEGYKAANAQLPPAYSNPNYSSQSSASYSGAGSTNSNPLAIAGFVCSLIFVPVGLSVLTAIAGLVLSIMGLNSAKKLPENKGHGLALAGTIISAIRIALLIIIFVAFIALMFRSAGHVGNEIISNWSDYVPYYHIY